MTNFINIKDGKNPEAGMRNTKSESAKLYAFQHADTLPAKHYAELKAWDKKQAEHLAAMQKIYVVKARWEEKLFPKTKHTNPVPERASTVSTSMYAFK